MPLLDHFHPPLSLQRHWESFHTTWASAIADALNNDWLPPGYFAEEQVTAGGRVEIDVATFAESEAARSAEAGRTATLVQPQRLWTAPAPTLVIPAVRLEEFAVRIYQLEGGPKLVAAIELVSPANKDRPETRRAFTSKCAAYLHSAVSLVIVDVVTSRLADLHPELVQRIDPATAEFQSSPLFAAAYRLATEGEHSTVQCWHESLIVGETLPRLPLFIDSRTSLPLDLEATYSDALDRRRIVP